MRELPDGSAAAKRQTKNWCPPGTAICPSRTNRRALPPKGFHELGEVPGERLLGL